MNKTTLIIGRVARPHGIKGEVRVNYYADSLLLLKAPVTLLLPSEKSQLVEIKSFKKVQNQVIIHFKNFDDRNAAESLRNAKLIIAKEEREKILNKHLQNKIPQISPHIATPEAFEKDIFIDELINFKVYLAHNKVFAGILKEIQLIAGQEIWIIRNKNQEFLFPAVPQFVENIDMQNQEISINPPPGLLDIYKD